MSRAVRTNGRAGRHGRPPALKAAVHGRLEEMRFRHGVLLMASAAGVLAVAVTGLALALTGGGSGGKQPASGEPPMAESSSEPTSSGPADDPTPEPRTARRSQSSSSTVVGSSSPRPMVRPSDPTTPSGVPTWWPTGDPRYPTDHSHWHHGYPPPWRHHH